MRMRHLGVSAAAAFVLVGVCLAQANDIRQLEQQLAEAVRAGTGLDRFYAADCRGFTETGERNDLKAVLARKPDPKHVVNTLDLDERVYGDGAITTGIQHGEDGVDVRFLRVWVRQPDGWRLVAFHGTVVSADAGAARSSVTTLPRAEPTGRPDRAVLAAEQALLHAEGNNNVADVDAARTADFTFAGHTGAMDLVPRGIAERVWMPLKRAVASWDRVQSYGDIAVVQGTMLFTDVNDFSPGQLRYTRVWVKREGAWKLAAEQRTSISS